MTKPTAEQVTFLAAGTGASDRTVLSKLRDIVSVKDFGAVGDGVVDDTTAFTNAVTAAGTRNVFVPGGSYKITGTVTGSFYSDATVTIVTGTVNTINRIGSVLSTTGNVIISTSGNGIDFGATADGSGIMTSELLNDYEEGTWTGTITFGGASVGVTYSTNTCRYTKVGRIVTVGGFIALTNKGTSTGDARIGGLPFTSGGLQQSYSSGSVSPGGITFSGCINCDTELATNSLLLTESTLAGTRTTITDADFNNSSLLVFSITYTT